MIFKQLSLTKTYIIAFVIIAMWALLAFYTMDSLVQSQKLYANLINLSGKQRMLSQKTALSAYHYMIEYGNGYEKYKHIDVENLKDIIITMRNDHKFIVANLTSHEIEKLYLKADGLNSNVMNYLRLLDSFVESPSREYLYNILNESSSLLKQLNEAVQLFERENNNVIKDLYLRALLILIGTIITLILVALFIIRPVFILMDNYTKNLEKEVKVRTQGVMIFNKIFEHSSEAMFITDADSKILDINEAFTTITGYDKKSVLGKTPRILHSGKQSLSFYENMWQEIEKNGIWRGVIVNKSRYGRSVHGESTIMKLIDEENSSINYVSVFSDITDRVELIKNLKYQKEQIQYYLDVAQVLILVLDSKYNVKMINQKGADILGYSKEEIIGKNWIKTFLPRNIQEDVQKIGDDIRSKTDDHSGHENSVVTKSGEERLLLWNNSALLDENDKSIGILTSGIDITDQRENERQLILHAKHAQMGEMISMIAHQWRQPLSTISVIVGGLKVKLALDMYDDEYFNNQIDSIVGLTQHLSNTINDFREFFKEDKNKSIITLEEIVDKSLTIIKPILDNKEISLQVDYLSNEKILTYSNELKQVVINILKNAEEILVDKKIKDAKIEVKTYKVKDLYYLEIKDNAGGVDKDIIERIFEPYFTTKGDLNGTGLGLYMSKKIIEDHCNGRLTVENRDGGACFTIELFSESEQP